MAELTPERVREALRTVLFPNFRRDLVTLGMVGEDVVIDGDTVRLHVRPGTDKPEVLQQLARAIDAALRRLPGVAHVDLHFARAEEGRGSDPFAQRAALPGVAHIVAVGSTKGASGSSTPTSTVRACPSCSARTRARASGRTSVSIPSSA